jgi:hypothetical protein
LLKTGFAIGLRNAPVSHKNIVETDFMAGKQNILETHSIQDFSMSF